MIEFCIVCSTATVATLLEHHWLYQVPPTTCRLRSLIACGQSESPLKLRKSIGVRQSLQLPAETFYAEICQNVGKVSIEHPNFICGIIVKGLMNFPLKRHSTGSHPERIVVREIQYWTRI